MTKYSELDDEPDQLEVADRAEERAFAGGWQRPGCGGVVDAVGVGARVADPSSDEEDDQERHADDDRVDDRGDDADPETCIADTRRRAPLAVRRSTSRPGTSEVAAEGTTALHPIDRAPEAGEAAALLRSSSQDTSRPAGFVTLAAETSPHAVSGIASTAAITARVICVGVEAPEVTPTR